MNKFYVKQVDKSDMQARLLYLMGATWHNKCMFDLDSNEDSFATILQKQGIESYTFDNLDNHEDNVDFAVELIDKYNIDYILGYSYGCVTAFDVVKKTKVNKIMFLDPLSQVKVNKQIIGDQFILSKDNIRLAIKENNVHATASMIQAYVEATAGAEFMVVPTYPATRFRHSKTQYFNCDTFKNINSRKFRLFLTDQSTEESRLWNLDITTRYENSSHWILIEPGRHKLASDMVQFIQE